MADARSPIRAPDTSCSQATASSTRLRTSARSPLVGRSVLPRVIACARDPSNLSHHSDRGGCLVRVHQFTALVLWCAEAKKALAFPTHSFSFSSSRTRRRRAVISASISRGSGRPSRIAWCASRSSVTHRPTTDSSQSSIPGHRHDRGPQSNTKDATSRQHSGVKRRREPLTGTSLAAGTRTRFTKCQQHHPKPTSTCEHICPTIAISNNLRLEPHSHLCAS